MKPFEGVLTILDSPSDSPLTNSKEHRLVLTRRAVRQGLHTLLGKPVNCHANLERHDMNNPIGIIQSAHIDDRNRLIVYGRINEESLPRTTETLGMSVELDRVFIDDMRADVWIAYKCIFGGAAVLKRNKAAYKSTAFMVNQRGYFA